MRDLAPLMEPRSRDGNDGMTQAIEGTVTCSSLAVKEGGLEYKLDLALAAAVEDCERDQPRSLGPWLVTRTRDPHASLRFRAEQNSQNSESSSASSPHPLPSLLKAATDRFVEERFRIRFTTRMWRGLRVLSLSPSRRPFCRSSGM